MQEIKKKEGVKHSNQILAWKTGSVLIIDTEMWKTGKEVDLGFGEKMGDNEGVLCTLS